jgi:ribosomal protein L7/L12
MILKSKLKSIYSGVRAQGGSQDQGLQELRLAGASPIECIKALCIVDGVGLAKAKEILHYSATWSDIRESHEEMIDSFLEEISKEDGVTVTE